MLAVRANDLVCKLGPPNDLVCMLEPPWGPPWGRKYHLQSLLSHVRILLSLFSPYFGLFKAKYSNSGSAGPCLVQGSQMMQQQASFPLQLSRAGGWLAMSVLQGEEQTTSLNVYRPACVVQEYLNFANKEAARVKHEKGKRFTAK